jgi:ribosomal protein S18 acetylase RimI-like enzyme
MHIYAGETDLRRLCGFVATLDRPTLHPGDLQWRLSAPGLDLTANLALWEETDGALAGFAFVQAPWGRLDYAAALPELEPEILGWAIQRIQQSTTARGRRRTWYTGAREDDARRAALFARHGFRLQAGSMVHLRHRLAPPDPPPDLPHGFSLRSLADPTQAAAFVTVYRAAFPLSTMTLAWRERALRMPGYAPDLDVGAFAADGTLVAFCLGWLPPGGAGPGELEPAGVLPPFRRLGLGRAVLLETFRRLHAHGLRAAIGQTAAANTTALRLYAALNYYLDYQVRQYFREFAPDPAAAAP